MRLFIFIAPILAYAQFCQVEEFGVGTGTITLHNGDKTTQEIMISDSATCFAGLRTEINSNSTRTFSIADEAYLCVGTGGGGVPVKDGASYTIHGGSVSPGSY